MSEFEYEGKDSGRDVDRDFDQILRKNRYDLSHISSAEESMRDFIPKVLRDKQKERELRRTDDRPMGNKGGSGDSSSGPVASGGVPPQPQRHEPEDEVSSEAEQQPQEEIAADRGTVETSMPDEVENETEDAVAQESSEEAATEEPPVKKKRKKKKKKETAPGPLQLRGVNGEPLDVTVLGTPQFKYEGNSTHPRDIPMAVVTAIRQELVRLGAPQLGDDTRTKALSTSSLLTALAMSTLDLEIPGVDENTKRAAEVLRSGQGRIVAVESKVEQVIESHEEMYQQLRLVRERSVSTEKMLQELELVMTWLLVDRITPQVHNTADPHTIELAHKTVLDVRSRLRKQAEQLREDEMLRRGRGQIVE